MHSPRFTPVFRVAILAGACCLAAPGSSGARALHGPRGVIPARVTGFTPFGASRATPRRRPGASPINSRAQLVYQNGPVMHSNRIYTIFWSPGSPPFGVTPISVAYREEVNTFFQDAVAENGRFDNVYSVFTQYSDLTGAIDYSMSFPPADTEAATGAFPSSLCTDRSQTGGPALPVCLDAQQLAEEINGVILSKAWTAGMGSIFFIYTPKGVGSCFEAGESSEVGTNSCAYSGSHGYCAYHSSFTDSKVEEVIFAYLPYGATPSCDNGSRPKGSDAGPVIDAGSHEQSEAITDPTGEGWWDSAGIEATNADYGFEIGDLCVLPEWEATYGPLLPGSSAYETPGAFNQLIKGDEYLLQREWSNAAGETQGACAQRLVPAAFTPPSGARATQPASFDGSNSGTVGDPAVTWLWDFGDGTSSTGPNHTVAHTYSGSGVYKVVLTVVDALSNSNTVSHSVNVGTALPAEEEHTATVTTPASPPVTVTAPVPPAPVVRALTASQLAGVLGLPGNGAKLSGLGTIVLGHAECPPACSIVLKLYTSVRTTKHHRRTVKRVPIGTLTTTVAARGTGTLALRLNAAGRKLLAKSHKLSSRLTVTVVGQEGGSWQIVRSLTLMR